ncbi:OmpA family protein [Pseudooceanicola sp. 502str34]
MFRTQSRSILSRFFAGLTCLTLLSAPASAQGVSPFEHGWTLDEEASELHFMSIKKGDLAEDSSFATLSGLITEDGKAQVRVLVDSVDTLVDLRNVRMRFLFFESFKYPEALITAEIPPAALDDLAQVRRKMIPLEFTLSLHGVTVTRSADVAVTLISNDRVNVSTTKPIALKLSDFNLTEGWQKLQEAANVIIVPVGMVSFDFVFNRSAPGTPSLLTPVAATRTGAAAALETKGEFDREACIGRFEILSRAGNIYFSAGSAKLSADSYPLLENLFDVVSRCPGLRIEIAGHTDSDGGETANLRLSELRAGSVKTYLEDKGIPASRMLVVGYGEAKPLLDNTTAANKARNRRIEFSALN